MHILGKKIHIVRVECPDCLTLQVEMDRLVECLRESEDQRFSNRVREQQRARQMRSEQAGGLEAWEQGLARLEQRLTSEVQRSPGGVLSVAGLDLAAVRDAQGLLAIHRQHASVVMAEFHRRGFATMAYLLDTNHPGSDVGAAIRAGDVAKLETI